MKKWFIAVCAAILLMLCSSCKEGPASIQNSKTIALDALSLDLAVGQETTLHAAPLPGDGEVLQWESSQPDVVSVDGGSLTANKPGSADITVSGEGFAPAVCHVTVQTVLPSEIAVENPRIVMALDDKISPSILFYPENVSDRTITWHSLNDSIVSVDEKGRLVAMSTGKTSATATAAGGKTANCQIEVRKLPLMLKLDVSSAALYPGESLQLTPEPSSGTLENAQVSWYSEDESVAVVDQQGKVTGMGLGHTTIVASTVNGKKDSCFVLVKPQPLTYAGTGNRTLENISVPAGYYAVRIECKGKGHCAVTAYDDEGSEELWHNRSGAVVSYAPFFSGRTTGVKDARIEVETDGAWSISFEPLSVYGGMSWEGPFSGVTGMFRGNGRSMSPHYSYDCVAIWVYDDEGNGGRYQGEAIPMDSDRFYYAIVQSQRNWTLDFYDPDQPSRSPTRVEVPQHLQ